MEDKNRLGRCRDPTNPSVLRAGIPRAVESACPCVMTKHQLDQAMLEVDGQLFELGRNQPDPCRPHRTSFDGLRPRIAQGRWRYTSEAYNGLDVFYQSSEERTVNRIILVLSKLILNS